MTETETSWIGLHEAWQRLAWAREKAGFTQAGFGRKIGDRSNSYGFHERDPTEAAKYTKLTAEKAREWAPLLGVRWEWLIYEEGEPWLDDPDPPEVSAFAREMAQYVKAHPESERPEVMQALRTLAKRRA